MQVGDHGALFEVEHHFLGDVGVGRAFFGSAFEQQRGVGGDDGFDPGHGREDQAAVGAGDDTRADDDRLALDGGTQGGFLGALDRGRAAHKHHTHALRGEIND